MERITITISSQMRGYIEKRISDGAYGNISEFVRDLIRTEQRRRIAIDLESLVLEGIDSGPPTEFTRKDVEELKKRARSKSRKPAKS